MALNILIFIVDPFILVLNLDHTVFPHFQFFWCHKFALGFRAIITDEWHMVTGPLVIVSDCKPWFKLHFFRSS